MTQDLLIPLSISADEFLRHYQGVQTVSAYAQDGRLVRLPARILRRFVRHDGIHGTFCFRIDGAGRLVGLRKL